MVSDLIAIPLSEADLKILAPALGKSWVAMLGVGGTLEFERHVWFDLRDWLEAYAVSHLRSPLNQKILKFCSVIDDNLLANGDGPWFHPEAPAVRSEPVSTQVVDSDGEAVSRTAKATQGSLFGE